MKKVSKDDFFNNIQGIIDEVKTQVDAYANEVFENAKTALEAEAEGYCFENIINNNGINLKESIKNIANSEAASNSKLMETIDQYAGALNNGLYEERLYESFLQNISKYDYLLPVDKEIKRISEIANSNNAAITLTKILEEMSTTQSYYILPLIEEDACRYVKNPSDTNRAQLRLALSSFAADPYCNAMLNTISNASDVHHVSLAEKAMSINDKIKFVREDANVSNIFSPVQYIKENESVFNANGQFFVKKGNTIAKLSDEYLKQLSENFISLCQLVNDPRVQVFDDHIVLLGSDKVASIYESYIDINGNREKPEDLRNFQLMSMKYDFDNNFFIMASCLHENFDNIAVIDFGKHIALNADNGTNVDMFRLGNNIYINAVNENLMTSTFYHNVNPIQCGNIINKHMGINVASLFEDLIPSQDKILLKLNETKEEYEKQIKEYEELVDNAKQAVENCTDESNKKKAQQILDKANDELNKCKEEYKEWQKEADSVTEIPNEKEGKSNDVDKSSTTITEPSNEPIDVKDVDAATPELTQPLSNDNEFNDETNMPEESTVLSDEEFDSYLQDNAENSKDAVPAEEPEAEPESETENIPAEPEEEAVPTEEPAEDNGFTEINPEIDEPQAEDEPVPVEEPETPELNDEGTEDTIDFEEPEIEPTLTTEDANGYKIANVTFDQNLKTGEVFKTGNVVVITPMVDKSGKIYTNSEDFHFYIDETTGNPIIDADGITVALYNAIVDAVRSNENYGKFTENGIPAEPSKTWYDSAEIDQPENTEESGNEYFDFKEDGDSFTVSAAEEAPAAEEVPATEEVPSIEDTLTTDDNTAIEEAPAENGNDNADDIVSTIFANYKKDNTEETPAENPVEETPADPVPTYTEGNTEIELPAATADNTIIPEINSEEAETPTILDDTTDNEEPEEEINFDIEESAKPKIVNESKRVFSLNEARNAYIKLKKFGK